MRGRHFQTELLDDGVVGEGGEQTRWIVSYADFITLMFAFFVVMYSISSVNDGKFRVLSQTMLTVFQNPQVVAAVEQQLRTGAAIQNRAAFDGDEILRVEDITDPSTLRAEVLGEVLAELLEKPITDQHVRVRTSNDWTEVELSREFAFGDDSMQLVPAAAAVLDGIAELARAVDMPVRVEGFTDNVPIDGGVYSSNRQLSAAHAARIADALVDAGVSAERVSAAGFGELHPLAPNASAAGRRKNRRVVIAVARHSDVGALAASMSANNNPRERVPARSLERVTEMPGPEQITL